MGLRSQNNPIAAYLDVFSKTGTDASTPYVAPQSGLTATGGVISDYNTPPGAVYRAHIFTSSGTFDVTELGTFGNTIETFAIGGGGGGSGGFPGYGPGRGGGAGGAFVVTNYPVSVATYPISVGAGGVGAKTGPASSPFATGRGTAGGDSTFTNPSPQVLTAAGGGGGGDYDNPSAISPVSPGGPGGCGGGGGGYPGAPADHIAGGTATQPSQNPGVANLTNYGFAGGTGDNATGGGGGGGGGTGGIGDNYGSPTGILRSGGPGIPNVYAYGPGTPVTYGAGGPTGGPAQGPTVDATYSTGDGGMGWLTNPSPSKGGNGGSGIVVVRYQIAQLTATQKATGGAISYYNGKTIHIFTSSGTFATESNWTAATVEYVVIGGGGSGGGGGADNPGGGGAGAYVTGTTPLGAHPISRSIQVGAGGVNSDGTQSYFGPSGSPIATAPGGGKGGDNGSTGNPGGSGGGGGYSGHAGGPATGAPFPGTIGASPANGWGHAGATSNGTAPRYAAGGGGGAGGAGDSTTTTAYGGLGMQLPTTFRDPASSVGHPGPTSPTFTGADTSGKYWFAGGGGGGIDGPNGIPIVAGGGPGGPYAGAGPGGDGAVAPGAGVPAKENSGSGGGGNSSPLSNVNLTGSGGSGIVIIAYPS